LRIFEGIRAANDDVGGWEQAPAPGVHGDTVDPDQVQVRCWVRWDFRHRSRGAVPPLRAAAPLPRLRPVRGRLLAGAPIPTIPLLLGPSARNPPPRAPPPNLSFYLNWTTTRPPNHPPSNIPKRLLVFSVVVGIEVVDDRRCHKRGRLLAGAPILSPSPPSLGPIPQPPI